VLRARRLSSSVTRVRVRAERDDDRRQRGADAGAHRRAGKQADEVNVSKLLPSRAVVGKMTCVRSP
jgi:hypothetical protein